VQVFSCPLPSTPDKPDCVFDASLVPETCLDRFVDSKGLINKFLESRVTRHVVSGPSPLFRSRHMAVSRTAERELRAPQTVYNEVSVGSEMSLIK
jgi:hypothetical protein